ncbi:MAG TPA: hypothetical protein VL749_08760 [Patescibacteria group bacterium]|nr:hypothetical protein [Patescibacteria group bacterium]
MTILISIFGFAGRFAGDLLMSALGWASSLLFGRVPRSHQVYLVLMMAGSFLWLVVVLSLVLPSIGSFLLAATPHPPFMDNAWLGWALLVTAIVLPLGIGLAGYLVPSGGERPEGLAALGELLRGYLLAPLISGLLIYLAGVGMARKLRSRRHGWRDIHIAIVVEPDGYEDLAAEVEAAVDSANVDVVARDAPRAVTVPAWLLTRVAGENVRRLRPDRLVELTGRHLRIGIFPSDIAISGAPGSRTLARAAILSRLVTAEVHLTTSKEAQAVEDELRRIARSKLAAAPSFERIDASMLDLDVPTDEWDILYRLRLQIERDLLVGAAPGTTFPGHAAGAGARDCAPREAPVRRPIRRRGAAPRSATTPS